MSSSPPNTPISDFVDAQEMAPEEDIVESTPQPGPCRNYCFTAPYPERGEMPFHDSIMSYITYQSEIAPSTGYRHLQGYVEFSKTIRIAGVKKLGGPWATCHLEKRFGTQEQAIAYCQKTDTREEGTLPTTIGTPSKMGIKRTAEEDCAKLLTLFRAGSTITQLAVSEPCLLRSYIPLANLMEAGIREERVRGCKPSVLWIFGSTGSGKSRSVREAEPAIYSRPLSDGKWWEGYRGQDSILFDDYRGTDSFNDFLRYTDRYELLVQKRNHCGGEPLMARRIYITSPCRPSALWPNVFENRDQLTRRIDHLINSDDHSYSDLVDFLQVCKMDPNELN